MASFLSGLMGGLKGLMGAPGGAGGLMSALPGAGTGLTGLAGSGGLGDGLGLLGAFVDQVSPNDVVGGRTSELMPREPAPLRTSDVAAPETAKKPGFLKRINTVDPETGMSTVDKFSRLGASFQDIDDGGSRVAGLSKEFTSRRDNATKLAEKKALAEQINALFPDDPRMQFLLKAAPDKAAGALADVYKTENEAYTLGEGQRRGQGERTVAYNPKVGVQDGYGYRTTPEGAVEWGEQRDPTWSEVEARRQALEDEQIARGKLDVDRGQLGVSRGNLSLSRDRFAREPAGGAGGLPAGLPPLPPGFRPVR